MDELELAESRLLSALQGADLTAAGALLRVRYTDTWVLEEDVWRLAVRHASVAP